MNLKTILAKEAGVLSTEEKGFLHENWDLLNDELQAKFASVAPTDQKDNGIDEATLKSLITASAKEEIEKSADSIAETLATTFAKRIDAFRAGVEKSETPKNKEADESTRKFLNALLSNDRKALNEMSKALDTTSDGSDADAGYTIPEPLANEVLRIVSTGYGLARQIFAYNLLTTGNTKRITSLGSTLSVFWIDEGEKKKSSQPSFSIVTLALKKLAVIVPMTEEVVEDSGVNLTELVATLIREAIDKEVDLQFFNGDGTVWTGIFNDTSIPTTELAANAIGSAMRPEDVIALADDTPLGVEGAYLMHRTVLSRVRTLRENADGTGAYLYNPLGAGGGKFGEMNWGTINGWPVILSEAAPTYASTLFDGNKPIMMFGDFKRGVAYGEKSDVKLKLLDQATITDVDDETIINLAEQDMIAMRAVQRVGMKVTLPTAMRRLVTGD